MGFKGCIPMTAASSQVATQDRTHQHQNQLLERQKENRGFRGSEALKWEGNLHSDPARKNSVAINRSLLYIA